MTWSGTEREPDSGPFLCLVTKGVLVRIGDTSLAENTVSQFS